MLSPKQLYYLYTMSPCSNGTTDFLGRPEQDVGYGTPYDLPRLSNFLKQLKYPCYKKAPHTQTEYDKNAASGSPAYSGILNTGKHRLALPYRILSKIDVEAFTEIQPDIQSGSAMAIRNACDITRACEIEKNKTYEKWEHRMGYEYLTFFGQNQITNCLMMLGPDLVPEGDAVLRGTGCGDLDCLPRFSSKVPGSALGASFGCAKNKTSNIVECTPCRDARGELNCEDVEDYDITVTIRLSSSPTTPAVFIKSEHGLKEGDLVQLETSGSLPNGVTSGRTYYVLSRNLSANSFLLSLTREGTPLIATGTQSGTHSLIALTGTLDILAKCCAASTCADKMNYCCGDVTGDRDGTWRYTNVYSQGYPILSSRDFPLIHGGILKRKSYGGYVNLLNNTGSTLHSCPGDLLLRYIQKHNNYDYINNTSYTVDQTLTPIDRIKTISLVYSNSPSETTSSIKDLVYNGYGVIIMTNVGFSNKRDSTGLSFPDRIWYHTFSIIGYDDRKVDYDDCVFLLSNSWGKWNSGGEATWGKIPDGSFLVTEYHLQCMLNLYRTDKWGCREKTQPPDQESGGAGSTLPDWEYEACVDDSYCVPWGCAKHQKALGFAFALSMKDGFPRQLLNYEQFFRSSHRNNIEETTFTYTGEI